MRKLFILFLCLLFWRCNSKPEIVRVKLQAEELKVIKETFPNAVCCYWQQAEYGFRSLKKESLEEENKRFNKWADSIYQHLNQKLTWLTNDTLYNPKDLRSKINYYNNPRIKSDTSFVRVEKDLFTVKYPKQAANLNKLIVGNYVFKSVSSINYSKEKSKRYVTISRVAFNLKRTKACYYISQSLPEYHWANGEMIFVEKKKNKWVLLYRKLYWIT